MQAQAASRAGEPVTVTIERRVAPGREAEFEVWAEQLDRTSARFPGFLGAGWLRPGHVGRQWHVVYRFDSRDHLANWERSPARSRLLGLGEGLMGTTGVRRVSGLETWFELPGRTAPAPPRWKMFVASVSGIYALQLLLNLLLGPVVLAWPMPLRVALVAGSVTALMTWAVMPNLARLLQAWLYAPPREREGR